MTESEGATGAGARQASARHEAEETTIRTRIQLGHAADPVFSLPDRVQGPVLALLMVHPLAWLAHRAGLLARDPGELLPLLSPTLDSFMQGSLLFALALLVQVITLAPPVLLVAGGAFWAWVALGLVGVLRLPPVL